MTATIQIEQLSKRFGGVRALSGLNLSVQQGEIYGFLGPNGAGKTTTLRILAGLARADAGQAWILGQPIRLNTLYHRTEIGVLPEEPAFYPWMTPLEYLRDFVAPLYGLRPAEASQRSLELLGQVGLSKASRRRIGGFSRGMRQRLGLAQALIHRPGILLLDEPVSALDPAGRKEVLELIESLRGQATILLSTHILADVERVCTTIGIINQGRMILQSGRDALLEQYALPVYEVEAGEGLAGWPEQARNLACVDQIIVEGRTARIFINQPKTAAADLLANIVEYKLAIRRFEMVTASLEDIFLKLTNDTPDKHPFGAMP